MPNETIKPVSKEWVREEDKGSGGAVLLVHGIGNAEPGSYRDLEEKLYQILGKRAENWTIYSLYYDDINDMFMDKFNFSKNLNKLIDAVKLELGGNQLGDVIAEYVGDVLWPVLSRPARMMIRNKYIAQLQQIVLDGLDAGFPPKNQKLTIICHSLGCFHTYETLHSIATNENYRLLPATDGVVFENVIHMASPVQLIRTVGQKMGAAIPGGLATLNHNGLFIPFELDDSEKKYSVKRWVSITGDYDPVGGYLIGKKMKWAYMDIRIGGYKGEKIVRKLPQKDIVGIGDLSDLFKELLKEKTLPEIEIKNPHSWSAYIDYYRKEIKQWL